MELFRVDGKMDGKKLAVAIAVPLIGGAAAGWLANRNAQDKFKRLDKPGFAPPPATFPIAWNILYTTMGIARYRAGMSRTHKGMEESFPPYNIQLGLNFLWSFLFFKWRLRGTALFEMTILLGAIALTAEQFYKEDRTAGLLMVPYMGWVLYALALNASIWEKNDLE
ncbi:MAG: TspO/MBR family protein [Bhargavaea sp.]